MNSRQLAMLGVLVFALAALVLVAAYGSGAVAAVTSGPAIDVHLRIGCLQDSAWQEVGPSGGRGSGLYCYRQFCSVRNLRDDAARVTVELAKDWDPVVAAAVDIGIDGAPDYLIRSGIATGRFVEIGPGGSTDLEVTIITSALAPGRLGNSDLRTGTIILRTR